MNYILFLLAVFFISFLILTRAPKPEAKEAIVTKACPPHKWSWEKVFDQDGKHIRDRVVCKGCGPLRKD